MSDWFVCYETMAEDMVICCFTAVRDVHFVHVHAYMRGHGQELLQSLSSPMSFKQTLDLLSSQ